eukprot:5800237-Pleurochrysis_carterae.AAC.1
MPASEAHDGREGANAAVFARRRRGAHAKDAEERAVTCAFESSGWRAAGRGVAESASKSAACHGCHAEAEARTSDATLQPSAVVAVGVSAAHTSSVVAATRAPAHALHAAAATVDRVELTDPSGCLPAPLPPV